MKVKQVMRTLHNFGTIQNIWCKAFINYSMIMIDFFGTASLTLFCALLFFWSKIQKLSKIYVWQGAILLLAIDYYTKITISNHTNINMQTLPQDQIDQYCLPDHILDSTTSKRQATISLFERSINKKKTTKICQNFNSNSCFFEGCFCEHKYTGCGFKNHGRHIYTKQ